MSIKEAKKTLKNVKKYFEVSGGKYRIGWRNSANTKKLVKVDDFDMAIILGEKLKKVDKYTEVIVYEKGNRDKDLLKTKKAKEIFFNY